MSYHLYKCVFVSKLCSVPLNCSCVADFVAIPCSFDYYLKKKESVIFNHHNFNYIVSCFIFLWLHLIWNSLDFLYLTVSFPRLGRFLAISSSNNSDEFWCHSKGCGFGEEMKIGVGLWKPRHDPKWWVQAGKVLGLDIGLSARQSWVQVLEILQTGDKGITLLWEVFGERGWDGDPEDWVSWMGLSVWSGHDTEG